MIRGLTGNEVPAVTSISPCGECTDRRAEVTVVGDGQHLCFDCLREHPEFRFFKILPGSRKPPKDITLRRVEEAKALREQGLSYYAIADRFSVTHVAVQCWLKPDLARRSLETGRRWYATSELAQLKRERDRAYKAEHPLYISWFAMRHRCYAPTAQGYPDYGGRGIKMHPTWENNFTAFEAWINANLGPRPAGRTLDRIDNDGNYEPGNVRWASSAEQQQNRRPLVRHSVANRLRAQLRAAGLEPCA